MQGLYRIQKRADGKIRQLFFLPSGSVVFLYSAPFPQFIAFLSLVCYNAGKGENGLTPGTVLENN